eukprot:scaffold175893_cov28-Tisochrysis_lutea.AAC.2
MPAGARLPDNWRAQGSGKWQDGAVLDHGKQRRVARVRSQLHAAWWCAGLLGNDEQVADGRRARLGRMCLERYPGCGPVGPHMPHREALVRTHRNERTREAAVGAATLGAMWWALGAPRPVRYFRRPREEGERKRGTGVRLDLLQH